MTKFYVNGGASLNLDASIINFDTGVFGINYELNTTANIIDNTGTLKSYLEIYFSRSLDITSVTNADCGGLATCEK